MEQDENHMMQSISCASDKEKGTALVVALIVLLLLTVLGTTSVRQSLLNQRSSMQIIDHNEVFQAAEEGLRIAENILKNATSATQVSSLLSAQNITLVTTSTNTANYRDNNFWNRFNTVTAQDNVKVVVENYQTVTDSLDLGNPGSEIVYYKITARGVDRVYTDFVSSNGENLSRARGVVIVQSTFGKRFSD